MRSFILGLAGLLIMMQVFSQNVPNELVFPDTLWSSKDSIYVNSPQFLSIHTHPISKEDTLNLGTSGYDRSVYFTIWTDLDTLKIPHVNYPNGQLIKIPIASPKDTGICILRFQANASHFTDEYAANFKGNIAFEIPETYELANVILYLTECSKKTDNHPEDIEYAGKVSEYFTPFQSHKLIEILNKKCANEDFWLVYYGFRENSACFNFKDNYLEYDSPYKHIYWDNSNILGGEFRNLLYLIQDFAIESNFRAFYTANLAYYEKLKARQSELLPINRMWDWLEKEFPYKMDYYKIVFSPLIGGSHSTKKIRKGFFREPEFQEIIMFINSPERIDSRKDYSEKLKEGLTSGIVFTEIDHNYVNPASYEYIKKIKSLISDKDFWAAKNAQQNYSSEYAIFNEYMTHSLFCLYILENYAENIAKQVIEKRINLMERRGFPKFKEFNAALVRLMRNRNKPIYNSYENIIEAMQAIK